MAEFLAFITSFAAAITACYCIIESALALRAKKRAYWVLNRKVQDGMRDHLLKEIVAVRNEHQDELEKALHEIESALANELAPRDQKFIFDGLHQSNRIGAQRYLKEVLTGT